MPMEINLLGVTTALTAFISVWLGHVAVRKIEAATVNLWKPVVLAAAFGLAMEIASVIVANRMLSTVFGILGITLLWDAFEFMRQAGRVRIGHAPANPHNLRHAALMAEPGSHATTIEMLKRDPIGRAVSQEEGISLITNRRL